MFVPGAAPVADATWVASGEGVDPTGLTVLVGDGSLELTYMVGTLQVSSSLGSRGTARARFFDPGALHRIQPGETFRVFDGPRLIFAGTVESSEEEIPGKKRTDANRFLLVTAVDYTQIADRHLVARVYETEGQTASEIARDLCDVYLAGDSVSADGVLDGSPEVAKIVFNYATVSEALTRLSELSGFAWWIDCNRTLRFEPRVGANAPLSIADDTKPFLSLSCTLTRTQYRNRQTVRGGRDVGGSRTASFVADGETSTWDVELPIARTPSVFVNGGQQSVGIRGVDDEKDPAGHSFFWQADSRSINANREKPEISQGAIVRIDFEPFIPILVRNSDDLEIATRKSVEGGTGVYEAVEYDERIEDAALAIDLAVARLRKFGRIRCVVSIETDRAAGLMVGHVQDIDLGAEGVSGDYLVEELEISDLGAADGRLRYRYRAVDGEGVGSWPAFFLRLAERGAFPRQEAETLLVGSSTAGVLEIADAASYVLSDDLTAFDQDEASVAQVGTAVIGERVEIDGVRVNYGIPIGSFAKL